MALGSRWCQANSRSTESCPTIGLTADTRRRSLFSTERLDLIIANLRARINDSSITDRLQPADNHVKVPWQQLVQSSLTTTDGSMVINDDQSDDSTRQTLITSDTHSDDVLSLKEFGQDDPSPPGGDDPKRATRIKKSVSFRAEPEIHKSPEAGRRLLARRRPVCRQRSLDDRGAVHALPGVPPPALQPPPGGRPRNPRQTSMPCGRTVQKAASSSSSNGPAQKADEPARPTSSTTDGRRRLYASRSFPNNAVDSSVSGGGAVGSFRWFFDIAGDDGVNASPRRRLPTRSESLIVGRHAADRSTGSGWSPTSRSCDATTRSPFVSRRSAPGGPRRQGGGERIDGVEEEQAPHHAVKTKPEVAGLPAILERERQTSTLGRPCSGRRLQETTSSATTTTKDSSRRSNAAPTRSKSNSRSAPDAANGRESEPTPVTGSDVRSPVSTLASSSIGCRQHTSDSGTVDAGRGSRRLVARKGFEKSDWSLVSKKRADGEPAASKSPTSPPGGTVVESERFRRLVDGDWTSSGLGSVPDAMPGTPASARKAREGTTAPRKPDFIFYI